jgi:hypothetical protein
MMICTSSETSRKGAMMFGIPSKALRSDGISALMLVWFLIAIGLASLFIPAWAQALTAGRTAALTVIGVGLFVAGASTVAGSLVGFLFGVPQYRRPDHSATRPNTNSTTTPNTNLEQISDWLTKIIVGVGLTQLPAIGRFFNVLGQEWGPVFGAMPAGKIIAVCLTVHYFVMGFFQGFLLSSLWLPGAFERAQKLSTGTHHSGPADSESDRNF